MEREHGKNLSRVTILLVAVATLAILLAVSLAGGWLESLYNAIGDNTSLIRDMSAFLLMSAATPSL